VDNTLWDVWVVDETKQDQDTVALRALNKKLYADDRVHVAMLGIADGVTIVVKK
jgi:caffeoyl-CoA O-methyltransferase